MKKRIIATIAALTLMLVVTIPVYADPITSPSSGTAQLSFQVGSTYSVTIPEAVTVTNGATANETQIGTGTITVAPNMLLDYGKELNVKISGANFDATAKYRLKDVANENYLKYAIKAGETPVTANNAEVLTVAAGTTGGGTVTLTYALAEAVTKSGTYTDTLTFTVSIDNIS